MEPALLVSGCEQGRVVGEPVVLGNGFFAAIDTCDRVARQGGFVLALVSCGWLVVTGR